MRVLAPVASGIAIWVYRHSSQSCCPWNERFAQKLPESSPFKPREVLARKDARTLGRELLAMSQEEFSQGFKNSPMKRAKLRGLERNAAVVLGNVGTLDDVDVFFHGLDDQESLVREHATWALARLRTGGPAR